MNRITKFRVWDVTNKKFLPQSHFAILGNGKLIVSDSGHYIHFTNTNKENYVVQEYTGLKDKDKNPICEGDIIYHEKYKLYCQCVWDIERLTYRWVGKNMSLPIDTRNNNITVKEKIVGNIFETKNYFNEIPQEVKNAAVFLGDYFKKQSIDNWTLYDVSSRK